MKKITLIDCFFNVNHQGNTLEFEMPEGSVCKVRGSTNTYGNGICIQDDCRMIGCDGVLDSDKKEDSCGLCDSGKYNIFSPSYQGFFNCN